MNQYCLIGALQREVLKRHDTIKFLGEINRNVTSQVDSTATNNFGIDSDKFSHVFQLYLQVIDKKLFNTVWMHNFFFVTLRIILVHMDRIIVASRSPVS